MEDSTSAEDHVEDRQQQLMVIPSENSQKTHLLKPCFTTSTDRSEGVLQLQNRSAYPPESNSLNLSKSVSFSGYRFPHRNFMSWATKMYYLHEPIWKKAGIFEAVVASTKRIRKRADLVLGIAEKWCPETKTFVFPWGEATITLEDVMVLLGFSVLGSPVFAAFDSSGEKAKVRIVREWLKLKREKLGFINQVVWMERFMSRGDDDELEHIAFLVLWLSYFVFPSLYEIPRAILPIAVHLSRGTRIALAPAVLAHLYAELTLLKTHIRDFTEARQTNRIVLNSLFKLVQVWTCERFKELQPKPNPMLSGEPRMARWSDLKQRSRSNVRQILENSTMHSFEWRPYAKRLENWEFPKFYPERALWVPVDPNTDDEFLSFDRCIKVSQLVGIDCLELYFPNRVASQFGMLQEVRAPVIGNNLSKEAAWNEYDKPIDDLTLYIPSRTAAPCVNPMFCEWWRKNIPVFQYASEENQIVETLEATNLIGDDTPSGTKRSRTSGSGFKIAEDLTNKRPQRVKQICVRRGKHTKRVREELESNIGKRTRLEADNNDSGPRQNLALIRADGDETVPPPKIEQREEETGEIGSKAGKTMVVSPIYETYSSDHLLEFVDLEFDEENGFLVSLPETRRICNDELALYGSNVEKVTMTDDGRKEPELLLHEDGAMVGGVKARSDEKEDDAVDDDSLKLALYADMVDDSFENRNEGVGEGDDGNDSFEKSLHDFKVLASSMKVRILKARRNVARLKLRQTVKQRESAAARFGLKRI